MGYIRKLELPEPKGENFAKDLIEVLKRHGVEISDIINGGIRLHENIDCTVVSTTTPGANVELAVAHTLRRVPTGFIVVNINKAAIIYDSGTTWTTAYIYIKCDQNNTTVKLLIF